MRLTDLRGKEVRNLDGKRLGKVHEVHCDGELVTALKIGPGSIIERLTARQHGRRIAWECVRKVERGRIIVTPDPPQRSAKKRKR
jgi:sporulation protein YlmC with PRC-barrel domain